MKQDLFKLAKSVCGVGAFVMLILSCMRKQSGDTLHAVYFLGYGIWMWLISHEKNEKQ